MIPVFSSYTSVLTIALPFLSGLLCFIAGRRIGALIGIVTAFMLTIFTLNLGVTVYQSGASRYAIGGWKSPLGIELHLDGLSTLMLVFTAIVGTCISIYAFGYFNDRKGPMNEANNQYVKMGIYFWPLWLFTWGGLNVLFLSSDVFNIYVALEIVSFSAIALVALTGSVDALLSAIRYFFLTLLGSLVYLFGVGFLYSTYGVLDLGLLEAIIRPGMISAAVIALMTIGLVIKTALFPMHFWLPPAHANAPAPVSAILSGLVVMGSFYLLVRLWFETFAGVIAPIAGQLLGVLGTIAIFWGALQAFRQTRLKMMLAYSTVAQIGYMFLLFPLLAGNSVGQGFSWGGGIYFSISHACAKASAFMVAGAIMYALGHDRIKDLRGLAQRFPLGVFAFALAGMSLMGLPPSGGFIGKWMLLKAAMLTGQWWYALLIVAGSILSACYIFRVLEITLNAPLPGEKTLHVPLSMQLSALGMSCVAILLGLAAMIPIEILKIDSPVFFQSMEGFIK